MNKMEIKIAKECDIDCWMRLVSKVKDSFPGLETKEALAEHRDTVLGSIRKESAICARIEDKIVGTLLFSRENNMLCFWLSIPSIADSILRSNCFGLCCH